MTEIISHPGKPLIVHLREVARFCQNRVENQQLNDTIEPDILGKLAFIQGAVHDIGKATRNFQTYIKSEGKTVIPPKHHALISAYLAKCIATRYLGGLNLSALDQKMLPYFLFTSVKRHHGRVLNFNHELESLDKKREDLTILTSNFYDQEVQLILNELLAEIGLSYKWTDFKTYMGNLQAVFDEFADFSMDTMLDDFRSLSAPQRTYYFYLHHLFFSTLLYADKTDVKLGTEKLIRKEEFPYTAIQNFRVKKGWNQVSEKAINKLKNQAYQEGISFVQQYFNVQQHLYSVTLPTGLGKTITSLAIAMEIKKQLLKNNPRIIITIPFTSIIDQNYAVFDEIFEHPDSTVLLKHHHLAEPKYKVEAEDNVRDTESSQFLIETWQSEIVVTTFVQLLESIFTNDKGKLLKLPNLLNSIIILDEVQQIKYELWPLIRMAFMVLGERYNCYFILMSATQPLIFTPGKEIVELIPNHQQYFNFFNRTKLINRTQEVLPLENFVQEVLRYQEQFPEKDILIILNTKKVTLDCFKYLEEAIPESAAHLYFLSTFITPFERKKIIQRIKNKPDALPNVIVSTQLIEAGVDISVHTVFRAFAPLDSIIQAAGRANRYWERPELSEVFLYRIEELEQVSKRIYGNDLLLKTTNVLNEVKEIEENQYLDLIQAYFKEIQQQSENYHSTILDHLLKLNFEDLGKFSFIEYRKSESLFVQLNANAQQLWQQYVAIYRDSQLSIFEKRAEFNLIKAAFYDYVVNVPVPWEEDHIKFDNEPILHFYLSTLDQPSSCYSYERESFRSNFGYQEPSSLQL